MNVLVLSSLLFAAPLMAGPEVQDPEAAFAGLWAPGTKVTPTDTGAAAMAAKVGANPLAARNRFVAEARSEYWAKNSEQVISSKLLNLGFSGSAKYSRVTCKTSICEVVAVVKAADASSDGAIEQYKFSTALEDASYLLKANNFIVFARGPDGKTGYSLLGYVTLK